MTHTKIAFFIFLLFHSFHAYTGECLPVSGEVIRPEFPKDEPGLTKEQARLLFSPIISYQVWLAHNHAYDEALQYTLAVKEWIKEIERSNPKSIFLEEGCTAIIENMHKKAVVFVDMRDFSEALGARRDDGLLIFRQIENGSWKMDYSKKGEIREMEVRSAVPKNNTIVTEFRSTGRVFKLEFKLVNPQVIPAPNK